MSVRVIPQACQSIGSGRTEEDHGRGSDARLLVRQEPLVLLKRRKPNRHLGHDTRHDRSQSLVQAEGRLFRDDVCARGDESAGLDLRDGGELDPAACRGLDGEGEDALRPSCRSCSVACGPVAMPDRSKSQLVARRNSRRIVRIHLAALFSLPTAPASAGKSARTLMVSSGWHTSASASPAPPPASKWIPIGVFFFGSALDAGAMSAVQNQVTFRTVERSSEESEGSERAGQRFLSRRGGWGKRNGVRTCVGCASVCGREMRVLWMPGGLFLGARSG